MKMIELEVELSNLENAILPLLKGRVFHVTNRDGFEKIMSSGAIKPNIGCRFGRNWGWDCETYFRSKGCISLCDLYHNIDEEKVNKAIEKYNFLDLSCNNGETYYFICSPELSAELILWTEWHKEQAYNKAIVPNLESGFRGEIPLSKIVEIIKVIKR